MVRDSKIVAMKEFAGVLKPCSAGTTRDGHPTELGEEATATEPMEVSSDSCLKKRKAEFDPEEEESGGEEIEEDSDERARRIMEEREAARKSLLEVPEWDVDSFEGVEYASSSESDLSSGEGPYYRENGNEHYRIYKRQLINSKGFMVDPSLNPYGLYRGIRSVGLDDDGGFFRKYCEKMVSVCLEKYNQDKGENVEFVQVVRGNYTGGPRPKSYVTFMAREKPGGPLVEYQAKGMATVDRKKHPILCRPAPTPKASEP